MPVVLRLRRAPRLVRWPWTAAVAALVALALVGQPLALGARDLSRARDAAVVAGPEEGHGFAFSPLPFETIDTVSGNLSLGFTDLALPGNAGFGLAITRSYNSGEGRWRLGVAGIPLHVVYAGTPGDLTDVDFMWPDGSRQHAAGGGTAIYTSAFGKFTPSLHRLELPNGLRLTYGQDVPGVGRSVTDVRDPFDNSITFAWQGNTAQLLSVTQHLLGGFTRTVSFTGWDDDMADVMSYDGRQWVYDWDRVSATPNPVELLHAVTFPESQQWTFTHATDSAGGKKLASLTNPGGAIVSYTWGAETFASGTAVVVQERTTGGTIPTGSWAFDWQNTGATLEITGPANRLTFTSVDVGGTPMAGSRTVASLGGTALETETLTYESVANPVDTTPAIKTRTLVRDGATYTTTYTYGTADFADYGQPTTIVESGHITKTTTLTYRHSFTPYLRGRVASTTTTIGGASVTQSLTYNTASGFLESSTTAGVTTTFSDNGHGNVLTVTAADGAATTLSYYGGVLSSTTLPSGAAITRSIAADGSVLSETFGGATVAMSYDGLGRPVSIAPPVGASTTIAYAGNTVTTTRGATVLVATLDGLGRVTGTSLNPGQSQPVLYATTTYDASGRVTFQSAPHTGSPEGDSVAYDALGRATTVTHADGTTSQTEYFGWGVRLRDAHNRVTDQVWHGFSAPGARLATLTDPAGQVWAYSYNVFGSLTRVDAPDGPDRVWAYDGMNRLTASTQPESGTTIFPIYDAVGRLKKRVDARGVAVVYSHDVLGRVTAVDVEGSTLDDATFSYDARGNVTTVTSPAAQSTFTYDAGSRLVSRTDVLPRPSLPASPYTFVTQYAYDDRDNVTTVTYPSGRQVLYDYDAANRLKKVRDAVSGTVRVLADDISYDASGAVTFQALGNGVWELQSLWAGSKRPKRVRALGPTNGTGPVVVDLDYAYDGVGNVTDLTDHRATSYTAFSYDALDRLTGLNSGSATAFTYDALGNRLSRSDASGTATYGYDAATKRLLTVSAPDARAFEYDAGGNVVKEGPFTYAQTAFNLVRTVGFGTGASPPPIATYAYDALQQRVDRADASGRHLYIYEPNGQILAEYVVRDDLPVLEREYIYRGGRLLASVGRVDPSSLAVTLQSPLEGQTYVEGFGGAGADVPLRAHVVVPPGLSVARVEYYQDGIKIGESTSPPYSLSWNNRPEGTGTFTFRARVVTTDGHAAGSNAVGVAVVPAGTLAVQLTSPGHYQSVPNGATLTVAASVTAAAGLAVTRVDFYQGTALIAQDTSAPYSTTWSGSPGSYAFKAVAVFANTATATSATVPITVITGQRERNDDFDGDGKADATVYRPSDGSWRTLKSSQGFAVSMQHSLGTSADTPIAGDFDGDGKADLAVVVQTTPMEWRIAFSASGFTTTATVLWGSPGDILSPADFDGDRKTDIVVFRPSTGKWYVLLSSTSYILADYRQYTFGQSGDVPLRGDFDGDGKADLAFYRPMNGNWHVRFSAANWEAASEQVYQWGNAGDIPLADDYDGDGKTDLVVYRPSDGTWWLRFSPNNFSYTGWTSYQWGLGGDWPVVGDFDGDGRADLVGYRPSTGQWYLRLSTHNYAISTHLYLEWGAPGDLPIRRRQP